MITVTIEVYAKTESDLEATLEHVTNRLTEGFTSGAEHYDDKGFTFNLVGEAEPAEEEEDDGENEKAADPLPGCRAMRARMQFTCEMFADIALNDELLTTLARRRLCVQLAFDAMSGDGWTVFLNYAEGVTSDEIATFPYVNAAIAFVGGLASDLEKRYPGLLVTVKMPKDIPESAAAFRLDWLRLGD